SEPQRCISRRHAARPGCTFNTPVSVLAAVEEIAITRMLRKPQANVRSLWHVMKTQGPSLSSYKNIVKRPLDKIRKLQSGDVGKNERHHSQRSGTSGALKNLGGIPCSSMSSSYARNVIRTGP